MRNADGGASAPITRRATYRRKSRGDLFQLAPAHRVRTRGRGRFCDTARNKKSFCPNVSACWTNHYGVPEITSHEQWTGVVGLRWGQETGSRRALFPSPARNSTRGKGTEEHLHHQRRRGEQSRFVRPRALHSMLAAAPAYLPKVQTYLWDRALASKEKVI